MDAFKLLQKHSDVALGAAAGSVVGPMINRKLEEMFTFNIGPLGSEFIVPAAVGFLTLITLGKSKPNMAVSFAAIEFAYATSAMFPSVIPV